MSNIQNDNLKTILGMKDQTFGKINRALKMDDDFKYNNAIWYWDINYQVLFELAVDNSTYYLMNNFKGYKHKIDFNNEFFNTLKIN